MLAHHTFMGTTCRLYITLSTLSLILKKKTNSIYYHAICESVAMGEFLTERVGSNRICTELATKVLYDGKRRLHVSTLLYNIYYDLRVFV